MSSFVRLLSSYFSGIVLLIQYFSLIPELELAFGIASIEAFLILLIFIDSRGWILGDLLS